MLDTNICIYVLKKRTAELQRRFTQTPDLCISSIVCAELWYGVENSEPSTHAARKSQLELFLQNLTVLPWPEEAGRYYGHIRSTLRRNGTPIGSNDLLIAAHARYLDVLLVTNNTKEFERVDGLRLENWIVS
ncbi:VapC toxin family PIN domain ribonuclease [Leucothrix pacifica]|uniref:VapC toxin family PIN domain ribonuclease n=2 Tax=Leucothrix pacifica TaxID=1247513 RepID=A0A317C291_9GAMM|nr:VapC toxin family PIN domain ribonuclease [Leucothrix pacifica]